MWLMLIHFQASFASCSSSRVWLNRVFGSWQRSYRGSYLTEQNKNATNCQLLPKTALRVVPETDLAVSWRARCQVGSVSACSRSGCTAGCFSVRPDWNRIWSSLFGDLNNVLSLLLKSGISDLLSSGDPQPSPESFTPSFLCLSPKQAWTARRP